MSFCKNCGNEITEDVKFCGACGTKITSASAEVDSSSDDKQEKVFLKYEGIGSELTISSEIIKSTYKKFFFSTESISIIPKNINSFECKKSPAIKIFGGILVAISILIFISCAFTFFGAGEMSMSSSQQEISVSSSDIKAIWLRSCIAFFLLILGLPCLLVKPQIEISTGTKNYLMPISSSGSEEEILNAIQSAISYKK